MHKVAKKVIEMYLNEQKIPTVEELNLLTHEHSGTKNISFVTLYKDGKVIASSGRVNIKKANTILELIENALFCLKDPRFVEAIKNPLEIKNVKFRVDLISNNQRKVVNNLDEIDISKDGLIIICQPLGKLGVILPNMANMVSTPQDLFNLVCMKAGLDSKELKEDDYILYSIQSTQFSDF
ncbi:MAG: AMMECR1 domain-containing protein [Candidatus Gracilibacteria bacterium]|nr:AMMECR1 domain-containing protein [Candidatus Gracilibacteria bacterium]MDD2908266.1 AMMECR1 domain-containing protein [Candidatus Gracilibacteria bacterium]